MIECPNCKNTYLYDGWQNNFGYCPNCGYAHLISNFERISIKRRILADFANSIFYKSLKDAGSKEAEKDWMLKREYITASLENNNLFQFIANRFGKDSALRTAAKYRLETHNYKEYHGAAVFYQYDKDNYCHAFKVMQYDKVTGKRIKIESETGTEYDETKEERALLYQKPLMGSGNYCLYGRHLLNDGQNDSPICVVESEKTALIASIVYSEAIWMATGSCYNLTKENLDFSTDNLILFPDPDVKDGQNGNWYLMAENRSWLKRARVSHFMENYCKTNNKVTDFDIADYIVENYDSGKIKNNLEEFNEIIK